MPTIRPKTSFSRPAAISKAASKPSSVWFVSIKRPIGRTPRSNLATYTGCSITSGSYSPRTRPRRPAATTPGVFPSTSRKAAAKLAKGKASSSSNCCSCRASTLPAHVPRSPLQSKRRSKWKYRDANIAEVLGMTVQRAWEFFADEPACDIRSMFCDRSASAISDLANRPPSFPAVKRNASSWPRNYNGCSAAIRFMCSTNRLPACTRPTSSG